MDHDKKHREREGALPEAIAIISDALSRLRYGAIQLTVHDGRVMQIDVTERKRLND
ncbi:MAG: YezD family protein [Erythrobacter sp.]|nr:YezD family protein [Erythrobacter sp.]MDZ4275028.1 YezD family protein [Erythrobacter sp.]